MATGPQRARDGARTRHNEAVAAVLGDRAGELLEQDHDSGPSAGGTRTAQTSRWPRTVISDWLTSHTNSSNDRGTAYGMFSPSSIAAPTIRLAAWKSNASPSIGECEAMIRRPARISRA